MRTADPPPTSMFALMVFEEVLNDCLNTNVVSLSSLGFSSSLGSLGSLSILSILSRNWAVWDPDIPQPRLCLEYLARWWRQSAPRRLKHAASRIALAVSDDGGSVEHMILIPMRAVASLPAFAANITELGAAAATKTG